MSLTFYLYAISKSFTLKVETFANRLFREIFAFREHKLSQNGYTRKFRGHKLSRKGYTRKFCEHKLSRAVINTQVLERFLELVKSFYSETEVSEILGSILFDEVTEVATASAPTVPKDIRTLFSKQIQKPKCTNVIIDE